MALKVGALQFSYVKPWKCKAQHILLADES
jgi:hypothetical protein